MKIPWFKKKWVVFGQSIKIVNLPKNKPLVLDDRYLAGMYDPSKKSITMNFHENENDYVETLYHELGHALIDRLGLNQATISSDNKELIVEGFSRFIFENFEPRRKPITIRK